MPIYKVEVDEYKTVWYNESGQEHRIDGPAFEGVDGSKFWYLNGERHREDGPAVERASGNKEWWFNGKEYTEKEFIAKTTVKELTIAEITELLGYNIKII